MRLATWTDAAAYYAQVLAVAQLQGPDQVHAATRYLCKYDLWFLMTRVLNRRDMFTRDGINPQFLFERCKDIQAEPDGMLDLWSREHYKSTIITWAKTIQDILCDPELTFGIFSITKSLAKDFLKQIKQEFEGNQKLKDLFPDVLYQDPEKESPTWGVDSGLRVRRKSNRRDETVEAYALSALPTGKHFDVLIYDDVVTEKSVTNFEQLAKAYDLMRLSFSCGQQVGGRFRMIGTRYHYNDAWGSVIKDKIAKVRLHPATANGKEDGEPVFINRAALTRKRIMDGPYIFACQMLQDPKADAVMGFKQEWLRMYERPKNVPWNWNLYLLVDPAGEKKTKNTNTDYTVMMVIGLAPDGNYYLVDGIRSRLNLTQKATTLFRLHKKWRPQKVGYEQYGMQSDIAHIKTVMDAQNYRFGIIELGGSMPKNDRIRRLVPIFEQGRFFIPSKMLFIDEEGTVRDFIEEFIEQEYLAFPVATHDDMLDCMARIVEIELGATFPDASDDQGARLGQGREDADARMIPYNPNEYR